MESPLDPVNLVENLCRRLFPAEFSVEFSQLQEDLVDQMRLESHEFFLGLPIGPESLFQWVCPSEER